MCLSYCTSNYLLIVLQELLDRLRPVTAAFHDHTEAAPACLEGTRVELLANITTWINDRSGKTVYWLSGGAGTGKTTVAQSVANIAQQLGIPCASFFFSRSADDRRSYGNVIPTLAYQLATSAALRSDICKAVSSDNDIYTRSVQTQSQKLIMDVLTPLLSSPTLCVLIVLDALDECREDQNKVYGGDLIPILLTALQSIPFLKVFLSSRRESSIERLFSRQTIIGNTQTLVLHRDIPKELVQADIELYLRRELSKFKNDDISAVAFPSKQDIDTLVERADGLFIYARTAVEYICDPDSSPEVQLKALMQASRGQGRTEGQYARLDGLYTHILVAGFRVVPHTRQSINHALRELLVTLVLVQQELSVRCLAALLDMDDSECSRFLRRISAVLDYEHKPLEPIRLLHASFSDYLFDPSRCADIDQYSGDLARDHLQLAERCLSKLNLHLHYNMCRILDPTLLNEEMSNLQQWLSQYASGDLQYSCQFWPLHWLEHIRAAGAESSLPHGLAMFCDEHLFHWMEMLSLMGALGTTAHVMPELLSAIKVSLLGLYAVC
jgi:hypothetical protein